MVSPTEDFILLPPSHLIVSLEEHVSQYYILQQRYCSALQSLWDKSQITFSINFRELVIRIEFFDFGEENQPIAS